MSNFIYCTYLTVYSGNILPPFYSGSTSIDKIFKRYHGSVNSKKYKEIWISEFKKYPYLFKTIVITTHETREEALEKERFFHESLDVVKSPLYINQAIASKKGCFGVSISRFGKDNPFFGKSHTEKSRKTMSQIGNKNGSFGKKWFHNPETKHNIKCSPEHKPENYIPGRNMKFYSGIDSGPHPMITAAPQSP